MNNKSKYNPNIHHRHSIRIIGYDYSQAGLYFITICVQNREHLFGEIRNVESQHSQKMVLNNAGQMIEKWYNELENKFSDIKCHEMIVMPNHFHCIIENVGSARMAAVVGADLRVCPNDIETDEYPNAMKMDEYPNAMKMDEYPNAIRLDEHGNNIKSDGAANYLLGEHSGELLGEHLGSPLHRVVQWFKTMTTNEYIRGVKSLGWQPFNGKLWQRNYYEHIIRNEQSYQRISEYILNNPAKWTEDRFYK